MTGKEIEIEGFGKIIINPISYKDREYENVDLEGKPLKWIAGKMAMTGRFVNDSGLNVPSSQVCKKIEIEGETMLINKLKPTKEIKADELEFAEDNEQIYTAIERKVYKVFLTENNKKLKKLLIDDKKTLKFPICFGNGYRIYEGILTNWRGQIILCGCRGNINEVLDKYRDDIVEIEIETIIQKPNTKRLLKALAS